MCIVFILSLSTPSLSAAVNPATCNTSIQQQTIISKAAVDEAMEEDELIIIVRAKKRISPPFIGIRGQEDWTHTFTGLKPSMIHKIQLEFTSLTKVSACKLYHSHQFFHDNGTIYT